MAPADPTAPRHARGGTRLAVVLLLVAAIAWLGFRAVRAFDTHRHAAEAAAVLAAPDKVTHQLPPVPVRPASPQRQDGRASPQPPDRRGSPQPRDGGAPEREGSQQAGGVGDAVHNPSATPAGAPAGAPGATPAGASGTTPAAIGASGRLSYRPGTWLSVVDLEGLEPVTGGDRYLVFLRNWAGWTLAGATSPGPGGTAQVRSGAEPRPPTIYEVVVTRAVDDATSVPHGQPVLHWFEPSLAPPKARPFDFARGA